MSDSVGREVSFFESSISRRRQGSTSNGEFQRMEDVQVMYVELFRISQGYNYVLFFYLSSIVDKCSSPVMM